MKTVPLARNVSQPLVRELGFATTQRESQTRQGKIKKSGRCWIQTSPVGGKRFRFEEESILLADFYAISVPEEKKSTIMKKYISADASHCLKAVQINALDFFLLKRSKTISSKSVDGNTFFRVLTSPPIGMSEEVVLEKATS
ncbi:hypothetical protein CEXT_64421 [Caerostris extrusa]|uniref:Ribosomal protein S10 n=1 Tax=Caerostris extrusa TaxID=172846 RepID=A0AAV4PS22_CAEEX|nr:hypothetical protein CEXT_64421 [Caerostris extrusa]